MSAPEDIWLSSKQLSVSSILMSLLYKIIMDGGEGGYTVLIRWSIHTKSPPNSCSCLYSQVDTYIYPRRHSADLYSPILILVFPFMFPLSLKTP